MSTVASVTEFSFYLSSDIDLPVKVRLDTLLGDLDPQQAASNGRKAPPSTNGASHAAAAPAALYVEAQLCAYGQTLGLPCRTRWASPDNGSCTWSDWLAFPIKFRDLPHNAQLAITVWGRGLATPLRPLAGTTLRLFSKRGRLKTGRQTAQLWPGVTADTAAASSTPSKPAVPDRGEAGRLEQVLKRYSRGEVPRIDWLDPLTFPALDRLRLEAADQATAPRLVVELPSFDHAVLCNQATASSTGGGVAVGPAPASPQLPGINPRQSSLIVLNDPEVGLDNPAELKAAKLARSVTRGVLDRDARPDTGERARIAAVLQLPPNKTLDAEERELIWRFRWSLTSEPRALTKFLACVDWGDILEAKQAAELMAVWAPIDTADALELLSPAFHNPEVRAHAVVVLARADDEELCQYLLQLVQALRYEAADDSQLSRFVVSRAATNRVLGILLHWYLYTEFQDPVFGPRAAKVHEAFQAAAAAAGHEDTQVAISQQVGLVAQLKHIVSELSSRRPAAQKTMLLQAMLAENGPCGNLGELRMPCPLDPTIQLHGIVPSACTVFKSSLSPIKLVFNVAGTGSERTAELETSGRSFTDGSATAQSGADGPAEPLLRSGAKGQRYAIIYKTGDDLRQDQLVVQLFELMDGLLKRENLDLRLTPYRVLPTAADSGMIEFVEAVPLARILAEHRTITAFLNEHNPDGPGRADALDSFVRSCAGYCVMTYILGVGDRHLDNLMLCPDGRLFHIDFGFIMGRDPKPFPPPMKLCKEMVDAMGGANAGPYRRFRSMACEAYNILRKNAGLILSLVHLMAGASITDIRLDPEKALLKLQEKLRLDMDNEGAVEWMQQLLNESATALMPQIMETTHKWAQYWR